MKLLALLLLLLAAPAAATLSPNDLAKAGAHPPAGARLPVGAFTDQHGTRVTLDRVTAGKPAVLLFVDYTCKHICGPGLTLTAGALHDSGLAAGRDYALLTIGIDPRDRLADAQAMAAERFAGVPDVARAAELLTGDAATIARATKALGYGYVYDASTDQFAHDASIYVFAADGHLAALLPELAVSPAMLRATISRAAVTTPAPNIVAQVAHLCYGFAAAHGIYGSAIVWGLQGMGLLLLLAGGAFFLVRFKRRRTPA